MNPDISYLKIKDTVLSPPKARSEQEIMADWKGDVIRPLVSIVCHTFNQVDYIKNALDGFLIQETDFPFEIILHDDASTDGTKKIVEEYAKNYPNIITLIAQKENKYSKGIDILSITFPKSRGDYICFCEGDDFWISSNKVSYQYYEMEKNKEAYICFHSAIELNEVSKEKKIISQYSDVISFISSKRVIIDRGGSMPSASLFFKNENIDEMLLSYHSAPIADFFIQSYMALKGKVLFLPEAMCVYRRNATGSWTNSQANKNKQVEYYQKMIHSIDTFYGKLKNLDDSEILIIPLAFYLKNYLLTFKQPKKLLEAYCKIIYSLEYFSKIQVTKLLLKEIPILFSKKLNLILKSQK